MGFDTPFRLRSGDQLCVIGVPGTGASGLVSSLKQRVTPAATWRSAGDPHDGTAALSDARLIHGDVGYDFYRGLTRRPVFVTLLRHPFQRTLALFFAQHPDTGASPDSQPSEWEPALLEFLADPVNAPLLVNPQTRAIAVGSTPDSSLPPEPVMLEMAKIHLEEFGFLAIAERAAESVQLLDYTFGWAPPESAACRRWVPPCPGAHRLSERAAAAVDECTRLDRKLYDFGCELFQWRYTLMLTRLLRASFSARWWADNAGRIGCWRLVERLSAVPAPGARSALRILEKLALR